MKYEMSNIFRKVIHFLEIAIAIIVLVGIFVSTPDLFKYFISILQSNEMDSYIILGNFFKHTLILVIGIELVIMIITHSNESIITLILFVVARKMLVYADSMTEIFIGVISILIIFIILKFLANDEKLLAKFDNTFSAAVPIIKLKNEYHFNLPIDGNNTLGGLIYSLANEQDIELKTGAKLYLNEYTFVLISVKEGVIERVRILKNKII